MSRDELKSAAAAEVDRHEQAFTDELIRLFDRQERVVLARLAGTKARKHTRHWEPAGDRPYEVKGIVDATRWAGEAKAVMGPLVRRVFGSVYGRVAKRLDAAAAADPGDDRAEKAVKERLDLIAQGIDTAREEVEALITREEDAGTPMDGIVTAVTQLYAARKPGWAARIATVSAVGTINQAGLMAAGDNGSSAKQWLSRRDSKVRNTHEVADGQVRLLDERFRLGGPKTKNPRSLLMFPGDPGPKVPLNEIINCRCTLIFSPPRRQTKADAPMEFVCTPAEAEHFGLPIGTPIESKGRRSAARVRTVGGVAQYGQSIGSVIQRDVIGSVAGMDLELAGSDRDVRAVIAKQKPGLQLRGTSAAVLRDSRDRVSAYVVWDRSTGDVLEVSVHSSLRGQRIGDQMVAAVVAHDPTVKPKARRSGTPLTPVVSGTAPAAAAAARAPRAPRQIVDHTQPGDTPGTSGDFDADAARIDRLQKAYMRDKVDTQSLHSRGGRWSRDREKQQQAIIDHFLSQPGVKSDRKLLVLGGLPGSGKTTTINSADGQAALGINLSEYVTVNADEVKSEMIARGMVPDYPGLTADESATLYHAESFEVAHSLMRQAAKQGKNFAYDTSLKSTGQVGFATGAGSRSAPPPYETTMLFVDVPIETAKARAKARYLAGGRYMPLGLIDGMKARTNSHKSGPSYNFDQVKGSADRWAVFENSGASPVLAGKGGRKARAPRTAPVAAPVAPAAAPAPVVPVAAPAPVAAPVPDARAARRAAADAAEAKLSDRQLIANAQANWNEALQDGYDVGDVVSTVSAREEGVLRDLRAGERSIMVKDDVEQYLTRREALAALRANGRDTSEFDAPAAPAQAGPPDATQLRQMIADVMAGPGDEADKMKALDALKTHFSIRPNLSSRTGQKILSELSGHFMDLRAERDRKNPPAPVPPRAAPAPYVAPPRPPVVAPADKAKATAAKAKSIRNARDAVLADTSLTSAEKQKRLSELTARTARELGAVKAGERLVGELSGDIMDLRDADALAATPEPAAPIASAAPAFVAIPKGTEMFWDAVDSRHELGNTEVRFHVGHGLDAAQQQHALDVIASASTAANIGKVVIRVKPMKEFRGSTGGHGGTAIHGLTGERYGTISLSAAVFDGQLQALSADGADPAPHVVAHELGHVRDELDPAAQSAGRAAAKFAREHPISNYGGSDKAENYAEAFAAFLADDPSPSVAAYAAEYGWTKQGTVPGAAPAAAKRTDTPTAAAAGAPAAPTPATTAPASAAPGSAVPTPPAGALVYENRSGKVIHVLPDGSLEVYKPDGRKARTTASAAQLAKGYGDWSQVGGPAPRVITPSTPPPAPYVAPRSSAAPAPAVPAALPPVPAGARVFVHPQGKHIYLLPDGSMQVYKPDGKKATSSATPQKLFAGYGGWSELGADSGTALPATPMPSAAPAPPIVAAPKAPLDVSAGAPAPSGSLPVAPMDFGEMDLSDVPRYIADDAYVAQQKVDGIRGVLVIEPGKAPWFASKKGDRLVSSTAAQVTTPLLAKLPATPAGSPAYRVEGEILNGKFHVFDMVVVGQESTDYETRQTMADAWVQAVSPSLPQVTALPVARTAAQKQALWDAVLASGAEGAMFKRKDSTYTGGQRVSHTLKAKITATADVVVLERNRGGKDNAVFGMLVNGRMTEIGTVSTGGKDKALGQIMVGEVVEVEYLWASAGSNTLTQPRIIRKRKDKTANDATDASQLRFVDKTVLAIQAKALRMRLEYAVERIRA